MASYMTVDELINSIKKRAAVPISQITFEEEDLINFANEEIQDNVIGLILSVKEEFYVRSETIPIEPSKMRYKIPYRAVGSKLRDLFYQTDPSTRPLPMSRIQPEDMAFFNDPLDVQSVKYFYVEGSDIVLCGTPNASAGGSLVMSYYIQPNKLVKASRVPDIISISPNTLTNQVTLGLTNLPNNITTGSLIDLLEKKPNNSTYDFDIPVIAVDSTLKTVTFSLDYLPDNLVIGDMVASAGECKIPQVPSDLHVIIAQSVACRVLESLGDDKGLAAANDKLKKMSDNALILIDSRVDGAPQKIFNPLGLARLSTLRRGFKKSYF